MTQLSNAGIPLRVIQEISGHTNLEQLQKYLVKPEQVRGAVAALSMLSHVGESGDHQPTAREPNSQIWEQRPAPTKSPSPQAPDS